MMSSINPCAGRAGGSSSGDPTPVEYSSAFLKLAGKLGDLFVKLRSALSSGFPLSYRVRECDCDELSFLP